MSTPIPCALPRPRPRIVYDPHLPVVAQRQHIIRALERSQVLIVCGETGSGKTTQLPKFCLDMGRGAVKRIGHTQPRRLAARATATRIAQELNSSIGQWVGYKIRFTDRVSEHSAIKLMTDGILLAEIQADPLLEQYDTLIIDEAHERSINIDFLLGYIKRLLPRRPDLKVLITSATLDAQRFSAHFHDAPVIEVSGRLFPITHWYRPWGDTAGDTRDVFDALAEAVDELIAQGTGDILAFLPGEREIREATERLRKHHFVRCGALGHDLAIFPLFSRQPASVQAQIFAPHTQRRLILATNVAETSLTVPGIRYVIDTGLARIKRYSLRNKVEQLHIEPISQACAHQRAGRCGRVADGICIRLYAPDDFDLRPAHTPPEILRSSLASVILRMTALGIGDIGDFPFLDPPPPRLIADGTALLDELGAFSDTGNKTGIASLSSIGQSLAKLPLDPKIARMILAARDYGALAEILVITAALSIVDPRHRPPHQTAAADLAHARWKVPQSEFLFWVQLWKDMEATWRHSSSNQQRRWAEQHFLSWLRLREWRDVHTQLARFCHEQGWRENDRPASFEAIHKSLLAGLIGHIGFKDEESGVYRGARDIRFYIHPSSSLAKKAGRWIMAAELTDTSRLYARCIATIDAQWLLEVGAHRVRRHVFDPHWEKASACVIAWERATIHGLVIYPRRPITFGGPNAPADERMKARQLFIEQALVAGHVRDDDAHRWPFFAHNQKLVQTIRELEHQSRRPDILVDETVMAAFFDDRLPPDITSICAFDAWRLQAEKSDPRLLFWSREALMRHTAAALTREAFPSQWGLQPAGPTWSLSYRHDPGSADDGVTMHVPLHTLNQVPDAQWLVPGLLMPKILALLKTLPPQYRHRLQPLAQSAQAFVDSTPFPPQGSSTSLIRTLTGFVEERMGLKLPLDAFRPGELAAHHRMNFRLIDAHGATLAMGRSLPQLRAQFGTRAADDYVRAVQRTPGLTAASEAPSNFLTEKIYTDWGFGTLPAPFRVDMGGQASLGFPGLVDVEEGVQLRIFDSPERAKMAHRQGLMRLFNLALKPNIRQIEKGIPRDLALLYAPWGDHQALCSEITAVALDATCLFHPWPIDLSLFSDRVCQAKSKVVLVAAQIATQSLAILQTHAMLRKKCAASPTPAAYLVADIDEQCKALLPRHWINTTPTERWSHLPRYLQAALLRLEKYRVDPARDARWAAQWQSVARPWIQSQRTASDREDPFMIEFRWLLEELRVALFAQELKTPSPVSVKRLEKMWAGRQR
jgi:ATP-dependent helicase HrpA